MTSPKLLQALTVAGVTLSAAGLAQAGSIQTPTLFLGSGTELRCVAVNATQSPITATVRIFGVLGQAVAGCVLEPNDPSGCQAARGGGDFGFCRITVGGLTAAQVRERVRGSLITYKTGSPFTIDAVVQAE